MKMQNEFGSTAAGTVREIHVQNGDAVTGGQPLVTIDAGGESA
jgi:biotin carboxyl carrier protein